MDPLPNELLMRDRADERLLLLLLDFLDNFLVCGCAVEELLLLLPIRPIVPIFREGRRLAKTAVLIAAVLLFCTAQNRIFLYMMWPGFVPLGYAM